MYASGGCLDGEKNNILVESETDGLKIGIAP
jgi:hypothetical protein